MAAQERREEVLRNTLRRETEWLRRGPARAHHQAGGPHPARAAPWPTRWPSWAAATGTARLALDFQGQGRKPRRLIEARGHRQALRRAPGVRGHRPVRSGPGTRLGLLGPNGCGKSHPAAGAGGRRDAQQRHGAARRRPAGGLRSSRTAARWTPTRSVADTVCPDGDFVDFRGTRQHRRGYLERFLFRGRADDMSRCGSCRAASRPACWWPG